MTQEKIKLVFARNTLFCGERIDNFFRREGSFFFDFQTSKKRSNASSVRSVPISELKGESFFSLKLISHLRITISCRHGSNWRRRRNSAHGRHKPAAEQTIQRKSLCEIFFIFPKRGRSFERWSNSRTKVGIDESTIAKDTTVRFPFNIGSAHKRTWNPVQVKTNAEECEKN